MPAVNGKYGRITKNKTSQNLKILVCFVNEFGNKPNLKVRCFLKFYIDNKIIPNEMLKFNQRFNLKYRLDLLYVKEIAFSTK